MTSISPLFAVQAEQLTHSGNPSEAIELCLNGIQHYSDYPTAYLVAAEAYVALNDKEGAIVILEKALEVFPLHRTVLRVYDKLLNPVIQTLPSKLEDKVFENSESELEHEHYEQIQNVEIVRNLLDSDGVQCISGNEFENVMQEVDSSEPVSESSKQEPENKQQEEKQNTGEPKFENVDHEGSTLHSEDTSKESSNQRQFSPLRIIEAVKAPPYFIGSIKSTNVNLISGLEFAPLKIENGHSQSNTNTSLEEPPQFPKFLRKPKPSDVPMKTDIQVPKTDETIPQKLTPLEELAARLEKVRIPVAHQEMARSNNALQVVPEMVTETMARIYEKQGAYSEAIKAYQILARRTPEKLDLYEQKIREVMELIARENKESTSE